MCSVSYFVFPLTLSIAGYYLYNPELALCYSSCCCASLNGFCQIFPTCCNPLTVHTHTHTCTYINMYMFTHTKHTYTLTYSIYTFTQTCTYCTRVHIQTQTHTYIQICTVYVYTHAPPPHTYVYTHVYVYTQPHPHTQTPIHMCICLPTHTRTYTQMFICICLYTYVYVRRHTHTQYISGVNCKKSDLLTFHNIKGNILKSIFYLFSFSHMIFLLLASASTKAIICFFAISTLKINRVLVSLVMAL